MSKAISTARASGSRGDVVVFVHGVGSTAAIWDYQLQALRDTYRCFAIELRGNGASKPEPAPGEITRDGYVDDVLAIADAAGAQAFHFVGCSLGGVVGFELWKRAPQRLRSLAFVGSFAWYPDSAAYVQSVIASVEAAGTMERFAHERAKRLGMPPGRRTDETIEQMACKTVPSYIAATHATWTGDYRNLLGRIAVPALVLCGERDTVAPPAFSQEIAAGIPGARLEVLADAGHVANADAPERFNRLLREFFATA
ncbi:MAG TPA: alpha/beta fold hydrolase [Candidatus Baltobacteraceae bacterium]|nr:alpha/beta fold hydrolase [Candidatus Baltobacteraceae bacterium]